MRFAVPQWRKSRQRYDRALQRQGELDTDS